MLESVIFIQLKYQIGCKLGRIQAIEASHCLSFPLLSHTLSTCQIQKHYKRVEIRFMAQSQNEFQICFLKSFTETASYHPQKRSRKCLGKTAVKQQRVGIFEDVSQIFLVNLVILDWQRSSQVLVSLESLVEIAHYCSIFLRRGKIEDVFQSCNLGPLLTLEHLYACKNLLFSSSKQAVIIGTVIQNIIQTSYWDWSETFAQREWLIELVFLKLFRKKWFVRWYQLICSYLFWYFPATPERVESIYECVARFQGSFIGR